MSTTPTLTTDDIRAHVARISAETNCTLSDQAVTWIIGRTSDLIARNSYREPQLLELIATWAKAWAEPEDMDGQIITVGATILAPFAKGGAGNAACMRRATVLEIGEPGHRGYGYWTRSLKLKVVGDGKPKTMRHTYPKNCMFLAASSPDVSEALQPGPLEEPRLDAQLAA